MVRCYLLIFYFLILPFSSIAQVFISANSIMRLPNKIIIAKGNIKISNNKGYLLLGDNASIDQKTGIIRVLGHVIYITPRNNIYFATYIKTTKDFSYVITQNGEMQTNDGVNIIAKNITIDPTKRVFHYAKYTKCNIKKNKKSAWCLFASTVTHNNINHQYSFYNLFIRFYNIPVFYLPYFYHYDSTIKRKKGFLTPTQGHNTLTGFSIHIPYFIPLSQDKNLIIDPYFTSKKGVIPHFSYEQQFNKGDLHIIALYLHNKFNKKSHTQSNHWYLNTKSHFDLSEHFRNTLNIQRTSDRKFFSQYNFLFSIPSTNYLLSQENLEGFWNRGYLNIRTISLQNVQPGYLSSNSQIPILLMDYTTDPNSKSGYFFFHNHINAIEQESHTIQALLSLQQGYKKNIESHGLHTSIKTFIQEDFLHYNFLNQKKSNQTHYHDNKKNTFSRLYQRFSIIANYPFVNKFYILDPFIGYINGFYSNNHNDIDKNMVSLPTLDSSSLFLLNRMSDSTIIDTSQRIFLGTRLSYQLNNGQGGSILIAKNNILGSPDKIAHDFLGDSKKNHNIYFANQINPLDWLNISNNTVLNSHRILFNQTNLEIQTGNKFFLTNQYISRNKLINVAPYTNYLITNLKTQLTSQISFTLSDNRQIGHFFHKSLANSASIAYENECLILNVVLSWSGIKTHYIKPQTTFLVSLHLKSIGSGEWHTTNN